MRSHVVNAVITLVLLAYLFVELYFENLESVPLQLSEMGIHFSMYLVIAAFYVRRISYLHVITALLICAIIPWDHLYGITWDALTPLRHEILGLYSLNNQQLLMIGIHLSLMIFGIIKLTQKSITFTRVFAVTFLVASFITITLFHLIVINYSYMTNIEERNTDNKMIYQVVDNRRDFDSFCQYRLLACHVFPSGSEVDNEVLSEISPSLLRIYLDTREHQFINHDWRAFNAEIPDGGSSQLLYFMKRGESIYVADDLAMNQRLHVKHYAMLYSLIALFHCAWIAFYMLLLEFHRSRQKKRVVIQ